MMEPILTIPQGTLRGSIAADLDGYPFYRFQGIPYAKPPTGELRFKAPVPPEKWIGILDATKEGSSCYAKNMLQRDLLTGSEDCLFLNVYTKKLPDSNSNLRPVMVWIHGGGFIFGSGNTDLYGPDFLITEDVVIVTINYRLGIFGFLASENPALEIPGNAGFKDMVMALKWVQTNIEKFNGDPNNVTIFGESAGGASVHLLVLSPMGKGLFHKAIAMSGSALNPWTEAEPCLNKAAKVLGIGGTNEEATLKYLKKASKEKLLDIQESLTDVHIQRICDPNSFGFVIESNTKEEAFLSERPIDIILGGKFNKVPLMAGYTSREGMCFEIFKDPQVPRSYELKSKIPSVLGYQYESEEYMDLVEHIQQYYFGNEQPCDANLDKTLLYEGDSMFFYGIHTTVKNHALSSSPVYFYRVSLETSLNLFKIIAKIRLPGTSHADDVCYLFKNFLTPTIEPGSEEEVALRRLVKLWSNFARYGDPTPKESESFLKVTWKPIEDGQINFLDIGENLTLDSNPEPETIAFWEDIYRKSPSSSKYV